MQAIKAKAKRKFQTEQAGSAAAEAVSGATKAGRARKGLSTTQPTATSPAGVQKTKAQGAASKEAARKRQQARVKAAQKKKAPPKKKK